MDIKSDKCFVDIFRKNLTQFLRLLSNNKRRSMDSLLKIYV